MKKNAASLLTGALIGAAAVAGYVIFRSRGNKSAGGAAVASADGLLSAAAAPSGGTSYYDGSDLLYPEGVTPGGLESMWSTLRDYENKDGVHVVIETSEEGGIKIWHDGELFKEMESGFVPPA